MKDSTLARLSEFRQLKKEIRGSDKHLIAPFGTLPYLLSTLKLGSVPNYSINILLYC
jgi:hypothetical protein